MKGKFCKNHPDKLARTKGLCSNCYEKFRRDTDPLYREKVNKKSSDWYYKNKKYLYEWNKKKRLSNPEEFKKKMRVYFLKKKYNFTEEDFTKLLDSQNGRCKICGTDKFCAKGPSIDHNHKTGKIRGILCGRCNKAIGLMDDNIDKLKKAIEYLNFNV